MNKRIVMIGDSLRAMGGMASVARTYRSSGLFTRSKVAYLSSYEGASLLCQVRVMSKGIAALIFMLMARDVGLVHLHSASRGSFWRSLIFSLCARLFRVPYLLHIHSGEFSDFFYKECSPIVKRMVISVFTHSARVLCLTQGFKDLLTNIAPNADIRVLPNPINIVKSELPRFDSHRNTILFLGRVTEKKGVFDLLRAMRVVLKHAPHCKLVIAGDGQLAEASRHIEKYGIGHAVKLMGWVDGEEKASLLREAAFVVNPSHFEAVSMSLLEAMASGKAVVATRVGGTPELVTDGEHGILVRPSDPEGLAEAIRFLVSNPHSATVMGNAGYDYVSQHYSAAVIVNNLEQLYGETFLGMEVEHIHKSN